MPDIAKPYAWDVRAAVDSRREVVQSGASVCLGK